MRIGLFTEGTYPVASGGVSTWCEHLITGLPEHQFIPVTLIGANEQVQLELPANVAADEVTLIPMWGRVRPCPPLLCAPSGRRLGHLLERLWAAVLPAEPHSTGDLDEFTTVLKKLTSWQGPRLGSLLDRYPSIAWIISAWHEHRYNMAGQARLTLADAAAAGSYVDRVLALADADWPDVDISHVASNGPPALLALGRWWQQGTPIVVTEHGIYLRERYLALSQSSMSWSSRYVVGAFLRMLSQVAYREAVRLAPVSEFNRNWEIELGAPAGKTATILNGVDVDLYHPMEHEPKAPTVSFVGRIDPLKALEVLIDAFALVRERIPDARLRLFGPTPKGDEAYREGLERQILQLGLDEAVTFEGAVPDSMHAIAAGHVVALSSISEGLPFTVIEAMMAGRATVNTDVGGVAEVVGTDGEAGLLVHPRDPRQLADGIIALLQDPDRRQAMGRKARARALELFSLTTFVDRYRDLYEMALNDVAVSEPVQMKRLVTAEAEDQNNSQAGGVA